MLLYTSTSSQSLTYIKRPNGETLDYFDCNTFNDMDLENVDVFYDFDDDDEGEGENVDEEDCSDILARKEIHHCGGWPRIAFSFTLVTFALLFSTVCIQMCPQMKMKMVLLNTMMMILGGGVGGGSSS